ncbi:hypothetical protein [Mobilicoccus caccae]|uniref:Polyketide cyclase/dehydrase/lipid transport protein n=1 Tax=Mobilicoccus caccae TaxID=1859295 RepID=A0ABQ6IX97_9MICO|nr:hypothetical protein [Mobilicoccus caccae]GMA41762.1 hypothetical protein GCM10025883_38070 [Mobilicoccus caccae]
MSSRWTTRTLTGIRNVHERTTPGTIDQAGGIIARLADRDGSVWPADRWPPLVLDRGLVVGSTGGHGPVRYRVDEVAPDGTGVRFGFTPDAGLTGHHEFRVEGRDNGLLWRHVLVLERPGRMIQVVVIPLHDALLEDLFDGVVVELSGRGLTRAPFPWSVGWRRRLA